MRARRAYDGNILLFDATKEVLDKRVGKGKVLLKMISGPLSYETPEGVTFFKAHPFQWVSTGEADRLEAQDGPVSFRKASYEDCEDYYADEQ